MADPINSTQEPASPTAPATPGSEFENLTLPQGPLQQASPWMYILHGLVGGQRGIANLMNAQTTFQQQQAQQQSAAFFGNVMSKYAGNDEDMLKAFQSPGAQMLLGRMGPTDATAFRQMQQQAMERVGGQRRLAETTGGVTGVLGAARQLSEPSIPTQPVDIRGQVTSQPITPGQTFLPADLAAGFRAAPGGQRLTVEQIDALSGKYGLQPPRDVGGVVMRANPLTGRDVVAGAVGQPKEIGGQ